MSASAPGPSPRAGSERRPLRGIPRSRAFWDLKAEQMMNRIFDPEEPIDLPVAPAAATSPAASAAIPPVEPPPIAAPLPADAGSDPLPRPAPRPSPRPDARASGASPPSRRPRGPLARRVGIAAPQQGVASAPSRFDERLLLIGALCGVCLVSVAASVLYFGYWNRLQQSLTQERNLLLVERLRSLGPATPSPVPGPEPIAPTLPAPAAQATAGSTAGSDTPPPPPPEEAWMEQLSSLPQPPRAPSRLLRVPVSPRLAAPAPAAAGPQASAAAVGSLPQLVGVVGSAGRAASAIFLVNGTSMSVSSGEQIGASGWRLRSAEGETALIERGGEVRQVSIVSGNGF